MAFLRFALKGLELLLLSAGLISTVLMVKGAMMMPYSCEIVLSGVLGFWNSTRCLLSSPLCICIIINSMVALIAFSSSFQSHQVDNHDFPDFKVSVDHEHGVLIAPLPVEAETLVSTTVTCSTAIATSPLYKGSGDDFPDITQQNCTQNGAHEIKKRVGNDKGLFLEMEVEEHDEEDDTMEATWKAITGGEKQWPKRKQLKKSETLNVHPPFAPPREASPLTPAWKEMRKSETFNDTVSLTRRGGLRRDPSVSLDDFNDRVEAFIKNFNDNMRLQRQESDQKFLDMMNRGL